MTRHIGPPIMSMWKIKLLLQTMVEMVKTLNELGSTGLKVGRRRSEKWMCSPVFPDIVLTSLKGKIFLTRNRVKWKNGSV